MNTVDRVYEYSGAYGADRAILACLAFHDGPDGAYPSIATIAAETGYSVRHVRGALRRLETAGELVVHRNAGGDAETPANRRPNRYEILVGQDPAPPLNEGEAAADALDQGGPDRRSTNYDLMCRVIDESPTVGVDKLVLIVIASYAGYAGFFPAIATIAAEAGCSEQRVQHAIRRLDDAGALRVHRAAGTTASTPYHHKRDWVEVLPGQDPADAPALTMIHLK
jgi:DNA-binding transcriptional regulator YhcF (GntR family)